jgi:hypothetical protein
MTWDHVVMVGDTHGNTRWVTSQIPWWAERLDGEERKLAVQLGDFGYWGQDSYLRKVDKALERADMKLWFLDGNHEHHDSLDRLRARANGSGPSGGIRASEHITWLTRGSHWIWNGRLWVAVGGAVSMDRGTRVEGRSWFAQEEISDEEEQRICLPGKVDVMLTHDAPSDVDLALPPVPCNWLPQVPRAEAHRHRLQRIVDATEPGYLMHGHYHRLYEKPVKMRHGEVRVTGLDMDGEPGNWMVLDTKTMNWVDE